MWKLINKTNESSEIRIMCNNYVNNINDGHAMIIRITFIYWNDIQIQINLKIDLEEYFIKNPLSRVYITRGSWESIIFNWCN